MEASRGKNLFFSNDIDAEIAAADIIFVSVNTPTKLTVCVCTPHPPSPPAPIPPPLTHHRTHHLNEPQGIGAGRAANVKNCELCARKIAEVSTSPKIVVEKSTVPVRTADAVRRVLATNDKGIRFQVLRLALALALAFRGPSGSSLRCWGQKPAGPSPQPALTLTPKSKPHKPPNNPPN